MADNIGCINILSGDLFDEAVINFGNTSKGDQRGLSWAEGQLADIEYYRAKLDLHILKNAQMTGVVRGHKLGAYKGAQAILRADPYDSAKNVSVESRAMAVRGKLTTLLSDMMDRFRPMHLGFSRDREGLRNVVREVFGKSTGDQEAAQYAQAWKHMSEYVRKRLEAAGARIGKLDDWGMPQFHDPHLLAKIDPDEWVDFTWARLDIGRMTEDSGLTDAELYAFMRDQIYTSIVTEGASKIDLGRVSGKPQGAGLLTQLRQHRFMHFKDGDSWLEYQDKFGTNDYLTAMTEFIDRQSNNIAAMEVLGPNPDIGFQHLTNMIRKEGKANAKAKIEALERLYNNLMGRVGTANVPVAEAFSTLRSFNIPAHLGNATLSMITDPGFLAMTAKINDVPAVKTLIRGIKISLEQAVGKSKGDLKFAADIGFAADYAMDRLIASSRFTDTRPTAFMRRLSEITMRANWMHPITIANKAAFQLEYAASLAKDVGKTFGELSPRRRAAFDRTGITAGMWDAIRAKPTAEKGGVRYMDMNSIGSGYGKEEATRLFALMHQETQSAVPTPGAEARAIQNMGHSRGTLPGEAFRTVAEFKSFAITILLTHLRRAIHQNAMNRVGYAGGLFTSLIALGYVAHAAKEVSKGRDIPSLTNDDGTPNAEVIVKVLAQSGGLGIYGDLVFQDMTRFGSSLASTAAGPTFAFGQDALKTYQQMLKSLYQYGVDDDTKGFEELMKTFGNNAQTYKPEIWQTRALQDRAINKFLDSTVDPDRIRRLNRSERKRRREQGQENFWAEDEWVPERAPGFAEGG